MFWTMYLYLYWYKCDATRIWGRKQREELILGAKWYWRAGLVVILKSWLGFWRTELEPVLLFSNRRGRVSTLFPPVRLDCHDQKKPLIIAVWSTGLPEKHKVGGRSRNHQMVSSKNQHLILDFNQTIIFTRFVMLITFCNWNVEHISINLTGKDLKLFIFVVPKHFVQY